MSGSYLDLLDLFRDYESQGQRKRGRPRKWTPETYQALQNAIPAMYDWFVRNHNREPLSRTELLRAYLAHTVRMAGIKESLATSIKINQAIKTISNQAAKAM